MSEAAVNISEGEPKAPAAGAPKEPASAQQTPPTSTEPSPAQGTPEKGAEPTSDTTPPPPKGWVSTAQPPEVPVQRNEQKISLPSSTLGSTTIANVLNQYAAPTTEVMFSASFASRLGDATEEELRATVVLDEDFARCVGQALDKHRVILLSGAQQIGKGTVAKYLAAELAVRQKLTRETYVVGPLESRVRILLRELAGDETFGSRVTIFEDAFDHANKDLVTFFRSDSAALEELRTSLTANDAYFIFTTASAPMDAFRNRLRVSCFEVAPRPELVPAVVERKLAWLESQPDSVKEKAQEIRDHRDLLVSKLQTVPRVASMIDDYLGGAERFDAVLERHASASPSLLDDLQTDVDAWCFALTLALAETADKPLSFSSFERLRRALTSHVKGTRELVPRFGIRRRAESQPRRSATAWLSDKLLLTRCRAVFRRDAAGMRDVMAFTDSGCGQRIRESLLDHHRRLLLMLAPFLRDMAEGKVDDEIPLPLRLLAAHTLGLVGMIDPPEIALPLLATASEWVSRLDGSLRQLVGPLVRGALAAQDERYRTAVLAAVDYLADVPEDAFDEASAARLLTAINAYSQLGHYPAARPMVQFRRIAERHCAPALASAYAHFVEVEVSNREQAAARSQKASDEARDRGRMHLDMGMADLAKCAAVAEPLQSAIGRLCHDDVHGLTAMRDWLSVGGAEMRLLVPYMFLVSGGIADALDYFATAAADATDGTKAINAIIFAAAASRQSQHDLAAFFCDLYGAIGKNPSIAVDLQEELENSLSECLIRWVVAAAPVPQFRRGMEELFGTLAAARGGFMRRWLFALIRKPAFTQSEEMKEFASAARRQMDE